jgi:thioredoxin 1
MAVNLFDSCRRFDVMGTKTVTDQSFADDVLGADGPVLVDFWAEWCGPCRMIAPALEEISNELGDKLTVAKLNIDENPETPGRYGVRGIPTMLLFKGGQPVAQKVGAAPRSQIQQWIEAALDSGATAQTAS